MQMQPLGLRAFAFVAGIAMLAFSGWASADPPGSPERIPHPDRMTCGPFVPPERTGDASGSTAMHLNPGLRALMISPTPVIVSPAPMPETRTSAAPSV